MSFAIYIVLILGFFIGILNVLPSAGALSSSFSDSFIILVGYLKAWNFIFPVSELFALLGLVIIYESLVWVMHVLFRVVKFLRGNSDGS